tara:strand:- start:2529 stop:3071 length:543 start_codon:yes stop_codon:yes gene_type:complete
MLVDRNNCILVIVDIQEKLVNSISNRVSLIKNVNNLILFFKTLSLPIILTEQYPKGLGITTNEILRTKFEFKKFEKTSFSCFANTDFRNEILKINKKQLLFCGIETHICIFQTITDIVCKNFEIFVVNDAVGSRKNESHQTGLNNIRQRQIRLLNTEMVLFELLRDSKHHNFKELSKLIR